MGDIGGCGVEGVERVCWVRAGKMGRRGVGMRKGWKCVSICAIQQKMTVKYIDPQTQDRQRKEIENRVKEWKVHIDYIYNKERR